MIKKEVPMSEQWYRDKETGDIFSLIAPDPPAGGAWQRVEIDELRQVASPIQ
jgi:hypothetical protein